MQVGNELVMCKAHSVQRMAKFCTPAPIFNADRNIVGYTYTCTAATICSNGAREAVGGNHHHLAASTSSGGLAKVDTTSGPRSTHLSTHVRLTGLWRLAVDALDTLSSSNCENLRPTN
jgi:hypothetical protein